MDVKGEYRVAASPDALWAGLHDPEVLRAAIPGCRSLAAISPTEMTGMVVADGEMGPASFACEIRFSEIAPMAESTLAVEAKGGPAGSVAIEAEVFLGQEEDGLTRLRYAAHANAAGKLARLGSRQMDATARKIADDFFRGFFQAIDVETVSADLPSPPTAVDEYVNLPAGVPVEHRAAKEPIVEDRLEEAAEFAEAAEERVELAAGRGFLGGPYVWGLLILIVVILLILLLSR